MTTSGAALWFDAAGRIFAGVEGIESVHGGGLGDQAGVSGFTLSIGSAPAILMRFKGGPILASSWERRTYALTAQLWVPFEPLASSYGRSIELAEACVAAVAARGKAFLVDPQLQALIPMAIGEPTIVRWPDTEGGEIWWRTEIDLQANVNLAVLYQPA